MREGPSHGDGNIDLIEIKMPFGATLNGTVPDAPRGLDDNNRESYRFRSSSSERTGVANVESLGRFGASHT